MSSAYLLLTAGLGTGTRPAPEKRAPLPPFDTSGSPSTTLPANQRTLPGPADKRFWRGNAWSVTIPGLPWVPGASSIHPERALTWFLPKYSTEWQIKILETHAKRGYTHFSLSWPDSRDASGYSVDQFIALCNLVKSYGFYVHVFLGSKDYDPHDESWAGYWGNNVANVLRALVAAGCVDCITPGWEWNIWNVPGKSTSEIYEGLAAIAVPAGIDVWTHFAVHYTWWGATDWLPDRFAWWNAMRGVLTGILYQGDVDWDMGERQARAQDTQNQDTFADGTFVFVYWEADAAKQFDGDQPDEDHSDMHGYLSLCSPGGCAISGFGNGARMPDGSSTLTV